MAQLTKAYRNKNIVTMLLMQLVALILALALLEVNVPYQKLWFVAIFVLQAGVFYRLLVKMYRQMKEVEGALGELAGGKMKAAIKVSEDPANAAIKYVNQVYMQMEEATHYIERVGAHQQEAHEEEIKLLHLGANDQLGKALSEMRNKIQSYQEEEQKRNWNSEGQARFAEILRNHNDNLEEFSNQVIRYLVKYLKCNQGSIFIENDQDGEVYLELTACYAYDKRKYQEKKFKLGQGLVGQCAFEKQTICITDIPQNYVHITSGLGEATPSHLVIVPLMVNEEFHGVIELASFQKLEAYQLAFLEKAAESIASTLGTLKVTMQTQKLLDNSQELTTELRSREEEMRHHLETLTAAQHEMQIKQSELQWVFKAIDNSLLTATFDLNGKLLSANDKLAVLSAYQREELINASNTFIILEKEDALFWRDIQQDIVKSGDYKIRTRTGEEKWINASFTPMQVEEGQEKKVLMLGTDITEKKLVLEKLSLVANNTDNSVIITDHQGYIEFVNEGFTNLTGYEQEEVLGKKPGLLLQGPLTQPDTVARIREKLRAGIPFYEEILNYRKDGSSYWISLMINPVKNQEGHIEKFVSIQADVTQMKETTLDYTGKLEAIGRSNAIVEFDVYGHIVEANTIFLSVTGYGHEEITGQAYEYLLPESEKGKPQVQMMWESLKEGTFFSGEFIQKSKEGKDLWLSGTFNPIFNLENKLQKILMFAQFTTHEKEKQNELSNMLEALNCAAMTLEMDTNGALKKGNTLFLQTFGYKRSEIARKNIEEIVKDTAQIPAMLKQLEQENSAGCSLILMTKEGEEKTYQATFNAMRNLEHHLYRVLIILMEN